MGRAPCCDKANVKKGPWSPEEDKKLKDYIDKYGTGGNWIALPHKAGLKRCGKSCRLRWLNYLRPNIKHGDFSDDEDRIICNLFATIGSRWSVIAAQLPGRTDNDIKNYWNTKLKKKLMGLPPSNRKQHSSASSAGAAAAAVHHNQQQQQLLMSPLPPLLDHYTAASTSPFTVIGHAGGVSHLEMASNMHYGFIDGSAACPPCSSTISTPALHKGPPASLLVFGSGRHDGQSCSSSDLCYGPKGLDFELCSGAGGFESLLFGAGFEDAAQKLVSTLGGGDHHHHHGQQRAAAALDGHDHQYSSGFELDIKPSLVIGESSTCSIDHLQITANSSYNCTASGGGVASTESNLFFNDSIVDEPSSAGISCLMSQERFLY